MDKGIERLKKEIEITSKNLPFLEEAKTDLRVSKILSPFEDSGMKRRRLFFLEQAIEKAAKSCYPLLLHELETLKLEDLDKKLKGYDPRKVNHFPKKLEPEISRSLLTLNQVEDGMGDKCLKSFRIGEISVLVECNKQLQILMSNSLLYLKQTKIINSNAEALKKFELFNKSLTASYVIALGVWIILGRYEGATRYPDVGGIPRNLLNDLALLEKYVEEFIFESAEGYVKTMKNISFNKVN